MAIQYSFKNVNSSGCKPVCLDKFGCPDRYPDFTIRRHDTKPEFKVKVEDCDGPLDIQGLVVEVNMWAKGKLKKNIAADCEYFGLADNIGFEQIMVGDIIVMDRVRSPEYMLVLGFDECNKLVRVDRGYRSTIPSTWKKGTALRIFRIMNAPAQTESVFDDIDNVDGTTDEDVLTQSLLVYNWSPEDVCLPGCYWLEFKVLKMKDMVLYLPGGNWLGTVHQASDGTYYTGSIHTDGSVPLSYDSVEDVYLIGAEAWSGEFNLYSSKYYTGSTQTDGSVVLDKTDTPSDEDIDYSPISEDVGVSFVVEQASSISYTTDVMPCSTIDTISCAVSFTNPNISSDNFGCTLGEGVEWVRRFPVSDEGFLIKIENAWTKE